MFYEVLMAKKAGVELSLPELHDRTKADDVRAAFGERLRKMSDDEVVSEYANRMQNRGRIYGGLLGAGLGSGLITASLSGGGASGDVDLSSLRNKRRIAGGILGAGLGGYLGGRYGRDHAYHVSDAAIPLLRKDLQRDT